MPPKSSRMEMKRQAPKPEKSQAELRDALERRLYALKPKLDDTFAEYARALEVGMFEDKAGEEAGTGEKRQMALQKKIRNFVERAKGMRQQLDSGEPLTETQDLDSSTIDAYLTTVQWIVPEGRSPEAVFTSPADLDWSALSQDTDAAKAGEYTLNPETQGLDFETLRAFVPDLSALEGRPVHEVMQHVVDTYGDRYHIPGVEYWKWLIENPTKDPPNLVKDPSKYYFFPGSTLRDKDGDWRVPCADWNGTKWSRGAHWLAGDWSSRYRVMLLEK